MKKDWTPEERAAIEGIMKSELFAGGSQEYTGEDDIISFEEVVRELEKKQRGLD